MVSPYMGLGMNLVGLLSIIGEVAPYQQLRAQLEGQRGAPALGLNIIEAAVPALLAGLYRDLGRPMLVVTGRAKRAQQLHEQLVAWTGSPSVVALFPELDALFYENIPPDTATLQQRLAALARLLSPKQLAFGEGLAGAEVGPPLVITSARGTMQKILPPEAFRAGSFFLQRGQRVELGELLRQCLAIGYQPTTTVEEAGYFSRRGGIVDIFPPTSERPVRLDFFGSEIQSLRLFDPTTQRSEAHILQVAIVPAYEVLSTAAGLEVLRKLDLSGLRPEVREQWARDRERLEQHGVAAEFHAPYFVAATILDYLPPDGILILDEPPRLRQTVEEHDAQARHTREELVARGELPAGFPVPYLCWEELEPRITGAKRLELTWREDGGDGLGSTFRPAEPYGGRLKVLLDDCQRRVAEGQRVVLITRQDGRIEELLHGRGMAVGVSQGVAQRPPPRSLTLVHGWLEEGFRVEDEKVGATGRSPLLILTDREIFGWAKPRRIQPRRRPPQETFLQDYAPGDYVVHVEHGIGRFLGLVTMATDGAAREYIALEYAAGDRLYVPTDQASRVSRYIGMGDHIPALHRLGTADWERVKARVKAAVQDMAQELLDLYATRQVMAGHAFGPDTPWQAELEASFPYLETPDQLEAIAQVKADMEKPTPMDRLLCGDVGYGKTEVALRAAFKAVMDGKQVALLVPTTVLAQQHTNTFLERVQPFPMRVEMLSRFRSDGEQHAVVEGLRAGTVDVCIGTHRLLQKDVQFKELGLVIVDEEQRFGVAHKEHLKRLRKEVDVLTLTATPIPRTLHMSLAGVRDMSTMETAPEERLPIKTYVTGYDEGLIREAILRELERGGQVYFVHNRVRSIYQAAHRLGELVPEATMAIGHGQMPEEQLERVMLDFVGGRYDILVCTTIIESGLDIPNVNTIIVDQSDRFGLAQLYQLRGRVGRGANRAYAYFLYQPRKSLTEAAQKRLETILEASELGAGFRIAIKDLEIRGGGNLLGPEQHGHVQAVGFDLYCQLLAEAVRQRQGIAEEKPPEVTLDLPVEAYLPTGYIEDEATRLQFYRRLAATTQQEQVDEIVREWRDRFGPLPPPAANLAFLVQIRLLAVRAGIRAVTVANGQVVLKVGATGRSPLLDRAVLLSRFGDFLRLGHSQIYLDRQRAGRGWLARLEQVLEAMASAVKAP